MQRLLIAAALAALALGVSAQPYPNKPIRFVVSYPAGGGIDFTGRLVASSLGTRLGQSIVVENRPGASGVLGTAVVAKAPPDGYTVLVGADVSFTMAPHLQTLPYDALKDFIPLVKAVSVPTVVTTAANSPFRTFKDFIEAARAQPGKLSYATPGNGSGMHIELEMLKEQLGIDLVHVPYKGAPQILTDTMAGQVSVGTTGAPPAVGNIKAGKLRLLAVWNATRSSIFPDAPTVREVTGRDLDGYPTWYCFMLPAGTPRDIVTKLETEIVASLNEPEVRRRLAESGAEVIAQGVSVFTAALRSEHANFATLFKKLGIKAD